MYKGSSSSEREIMSLPRRKGHFIDGCTVVKARIIQRRVEACRRRTSPVLFESSASIPSFSHQTPCPFDVAAVLGAFCRVKVGFLVCCFEKFRSRFVMGLGLVLCGGRNRVKLYLGLQSQVIDSLTGLETVQPFLKRGFG